MQLSITDKSQNTHIHLPSDLYKRNWDSKQCNDEWGVSPRPTSKFWEKKIKSVSVLPLVTMIWPWNIQKLTWNFKKLKFYCVQIEVLSKFQSSIPIFQKKKNLEISNKVQNKFLCVQLEECRRNFSLNRYFEKNYLFLEFWWWETNTQIHKQTSKNKKPSLKHKQCNHASGKHRLEKTTY